MNYAIIEDELYASRRLQLAIERLHPDYSLAFTAQSVAEAVEAILSQQVDLIFMDIELNDGVCFEIFNRINVSVPIIFTTAYDEYTLQAFKVNSVDYLLKPIADGDLAAAIAKFERLHKNNATPQADLSAIAAMLTGRQVQRILTVSGDNYDYVDLGDVAMVESEDRVVFIYPRTGHRRMTSFTSLNDVMAIVPNSQFFQVSRSEIVNIDAIARVSKYFRGRLIVKVNVGEGEKQLTVSALRRDEFLNWLGK